MKNTRKTVWKSPNTVAYFFIAMLAKFLLKVLFNHKIEKNIKLEKGKPYVIISNHASILDILMMIATVYPTKINIVAGKSYFSHSVLKHIFKALRCIPKKQFAIDLESIRIIKNVIDDNRCVALYPEGKVTLDGKQLHYIPPGIGKFIKMLNCEVVITKVSGSSLVRPRFFHSYKRGKIKTVLDRVISSDEISKLSNIEVYNRIQKSIEYNDNIFQQENKLIYKSKKPALGYHYAYYKCPKCEVEYKIKSTDTHLICSDCNNSVEYTIEGKLIPEKDSVAFDRLDLWYDYQRKACKEEIAKEDFYIETPCTCHINYENTKSFVEVGSGIAFINKGYIGYKGTKDNKPYDINIPLKLLHTISTKNEEAIELVNEDGIIRLDFTENKLSTKFGLLVEENYRLNYIK